MPDELRSGADIIDIYTRRQAIEDGVLVQLSGPGYQGDPWVPAMVAEAGFRYPVAMTATAFCRYVAPLEGDGEKLAPCQDIKGRLWDVLWMLKAEIRRIQIPAKGTVPFSLTRKLGQSPSRPRAPFCTSACEWCPLSQRITEPKRRTRAIISQTVREMDADLTRVVGPLAGRYY
ncbi:MAG: DUF6573 family protein [Thermoguttaceae bacterium]|jgi:hypothetical protein